MVAVNTLRGIGYGFRLVIYVLLVTVAGVIPAAVGVKLVRDGNPKGAVFVFVGFLITYAGSLGMLYKVIADAVARGNKVVETGNGEKFEVEEITESIDNLSDKIDKMDGE